MALWISTCAYRSKHISEDVELGSIFLLILKQHWPLPKGVIHCKKSYRFLSCASDWNRVPELRFFFPDSKMRGCLHRRWRKKWQRLEVRGKHGVRWVEEGFKRKENFLESAVPPSSTGRFCVSWTKFQNLEIKSYLNFLLISHIVTAILVGNKDPLWTKLLWILICSNRIFHFFL